MITPGLPRAIKSSGMRPIFRAELTRGQGGNDDTWFGYCNGIGNLFFGSADISINDISFIFKGFVFRYTDQTVCEFESPSDDEEDISNIMITWEYRVNGDLLSPPGNSAFWPISNSSQALWEDSSRYEWGDESIIFEIFGEIDW